MSAAAASASGNVIIAQVLYDPINSESGGEAVELYNPTDSAIDISGWTISTETSLTDAVFPEGTVLRSGGYYLVADAGWSTNKDIVSWPDADYEEALTLANTDAGVALSKGSSIIDAVGWGAAAGIGSGLYEGNPHAGAESGESLTRLKDGSGYVDTGNNANDFAAAAPLFHNSSYGNGYNSGEISVIAVVEGSFPVINSINILIDDDSFTPGSQINPEPKKNRSIEIEAVVSHSNGYGYIGSVVAHIGNSSVTMAAAQTNETSSLYTAKLNMSYYAPAGSYAVTVTATDASGFSANSSATFEYTELLAMEIDTASLKFAAMPGTVSEIGGDYDEGTANATVINIGNSVMDVQLSGTNLSSGGSVMGANRIQYTFNGDYESSLAGSLSNEKQTKQVGIAAASRMPLSFRLDVPTATSPGNYTGTITLIAVKP